MTNFKNFAQLSRTEMKNIKGGLRDPNNPDDGAVDCKVYSINSNGTRTLLSTFHTSPSDAAQSATNRAVECGCRVGYDCDGKVNVN